MIRDISCIILLSITILGIVSIITSLFTRPRYRILEVEHKSGEIDYNVQVSKLFGLPGTWSIVVIDMGLYDLRLKGCDLEAAKRYVAKFEKEDEEERGYRVKKKKVWK